MAPALKCDCGACQRCKHRVYMRDYNHRPENAEKNRLRVKSYREQHLVIVRSRDRARGFHEHDREKTAARNAARVLRKEPHDCEQCGAPDAQAHHDDYSKPLDVRWLCRTCHGIEHRRF